MVHQRVWQGCVEQTFPEAMWTFCSDRKLKGSPTSGAFSNSLRTGLKLPQRTVWDCSQWLRSVLAFVCVGQQLLT